ncbi:MAG TPA: Uma2 family endonuclease [Polyangiaceae bacterium]
MQAAELPLHARPRRLTRLEYERLSDEGFYRRERVELIQGIVVEMSPIGPTHADPLDVLMEKLVPLLIGRARVRVQQPFALGDDSEPEPDLAIVPPGRYADRHPDRAFLIVEVAETSLAYDRDTKAPLYAAAGVPEYWIVDVSGKAVEVLDEPANGRYGRSRRFDRTATLPVPGFDDIQVCIDDLFA